MLSKRWCFVVFIHFLFFYSYRVDAQNEPVYDEISVYLQVKDIGQVEIPSVIQEDVIFLPAKEIFEFLNFKTTMSQSMDSISGFFITIKEPYVIDFKNHFIHFQGKQFQLKKGDMIRTETNLYLRYNFFGEIFGLNCKFSIRSLAVSMETALELPAMREKRLEQMRQNINRVSGNIKADTIIPRHYPFFHIGMADWSIMSTQDIGKKVDNRINLALGTVLAGGEANFLLNYNTNEQFAEKQQYYNLRYVNNNRSWLRQTIIGKIGTDAVSSIYNPVVGIRLTNTPTTYRRSFGTYAMSDYTNPNWTVELYVNNVLVDYQKADASGFFSFQVPLVYGNSLVKFKFYGPWGEERYKEQTLTIPFNFIPIKKLEYTAAAGIVEDDKGSIFSRANFNYGLSKSMTIGAGVEYLSTLSNDNIMPFASVTTRPLSNLILAGEYMYGVRSKSILSYQFLKNIQLELNYIKYEPGQKAVNFNYLEERKAIVTLPIKSDKVSIYNRLTYDRILMPGTQYTTAEWLISGSFWGFNTNLTNNAMFSEHSSPYTYSNLSTSFRLPGGYMLLPQTQFSFTRGQVISAKIGIEKYVLKNGFFSLSYENNFLSGTQMAQFGFRYDFPFAQAGITLRQSNSGSTTMELARGSLIMDAKTRYFGANNRVSVGKGALVFAPFLDLNCNNRRDPGEPKEFDLNIRISGGRPFQDDKDSTIRVIDLEPYTIYFVEFDQNSFNSVSWKLRKKTMNVVVDPNQFKLIEVPIAVYGEVSGTVTKKGQSESTGIGRILVNFFNLKAQQVGKTLTEPDGYFSFLGLAPGKYYAQVDTAQLKRIQMICEPDTLHFSIKQSRDGDIVEGKDFLLKSTKKEDEIFPFEKVEESKAQAAKAPEVNPATEKIKAIPVQSAADAGKKTASTVKQTVASVTSTPITLKSDTIKNASNKTITIQVSEAKSAGAKSSADKTPVTQPTSKFSKVKKLYFVQLGAFKNQANAARIVVNLTQTIPYKLEITQINQLYKVRFGGFNTRKEAEKCINLIDEKGRVSKESLFIVSEEVISEATPGATKALDAATPLSGAAGPEVQVGTFQQRDNAQKLADKMSSEAPYPIHIVQEQGLFAVRFGPFQNSSEALNCQKLLEKKNFKVIIKK